MVIRSHLEIYKLSRLLDCKIMWGQEIDEKWYNSISTKLFNTECDRLINCSGKPLRGTLKRPFYQVFFWGHVRDENWYVLSFRRKVSKIGNSILKIGKNCCSKVIKQYKIQNSQKYVLNLFTEFITCICFIVWLWAVLIIVTNFPMSDLSFVEYFNFLFPFYFLIYD